MFVLNNTRYKQRSATPQQASKPKYTCVTSVIHMLLASSS